MYAIVETGGKQYRIRQGDVVRVERLNAEIGAQVDLDRVNLVADQGTVQLGKPTVAGAVVRATVVQQGRGRKVLAFKKKRRQGYRRKIGHRQAFSGLRIDEIVIPSQPAIESRTITKTDPEKPSDEDRAIAAKPSAVEKAPKQKAAAKPASKKTTKKKAGAKAAARKATRKKAGSTAKKKRGA